MSDWLLHHEIERQANWHGDKTAFVFEGTEFTYAVFDDRVNQASNALVDAGIEPGDTVFAHSLNHVDLFTLFFACSKTGAIYATLSRFQSPANVEYVCGQLGPDIVFYSPDEPILDGLFPQIRELVTDVPYVCLDDDPLDGDQYFGAFLKGHSSERSETSDDFSPSRVHHLNHTSGTTGHPKFVLRNHRSTIHFAEGLVYEFPFDKADRRLITGDMMTGRAAYVQIGLPTLNETGTIFLLRKFSPALVCEQVQEQDINAMALGFTRANLVLEYAEKEDIDIHIDYLHSPLSSPNQAKQLWDISSELYNYYGQTEAGVPLAKRVEPPFDSTPSLGQPTRGSDIRLIPSGDEKSLRKRKRIEPGMEGELVVRGEGVMDEFLEEENQRQYMKKNWVFTGDVVRINDDYEILFAGRTDDRIRSGGINIFPSTIEDILESHPNVADSVVVGVDDDKWGDRVSAIIIPEDPDISHEELIQDLEEFCLENDEMAREIRPRQYAVVASLDEVPKGALGKIDVDALIEKFFED